MSDSPASHQAEPHAALVRRFAAAWEGGRWPHIEEFLREAESDAAIDRRALAQDLVRLDLEYRWGDAVDPEAQTAQFLLARDDQGPALPQRPLLEDYIARFPLLGPPTHLPVALVAHEYRVRRQQGERPEHAEYLRRFGALPALGAALAEVDLALAAIETVTAGDAASTARTSSAASLRVRCPACHTPVSLDDDSPLERLRCPACQHEFSLVGGPAAGSATGAEADPPRRLGHFELIEVLGSGASGTVWKAQDTQLQRIVAVKIPRRDELSRSDLEKVLREARAAAQLSHPNIVAVHEVGIEDDSVYIVSDFIEGRSLDKWLADRQPAPDDAAQLTAQLAAALDYAHSCGVIHRDLKPGNILMDGAGQPHITDFGLAKRERGETLLTMEGQILGTPAYMSPEQALGESHRADRRTDIYSLGVILFELLTGERPFRGDLRMLLTQVVEDEPPAPRKLKHTIPIDLETICLKCLRKEPRLRYATAGELADELARYRRGEPIHARPLGIPGKAWRWCRRYPVVAALAATACLLLVGLLTTISVAYVREAALRRQSDERREQAEAALYVNRIALSQQKLLRGNVQHAEQILDACPPQRRRWEWAYLKHLCHLPLQTYRGHQGPVMGVACSPDGELLATAGSDAAVRLWNIATAEVVQTLQGHEGWVRAVAFNADGSQLATAGSDAAVVLWDSATGQPRLTFRGHRRPVTSVAFSPNQPWVASADDDGKVILWDGRTGEEIRTLRGRGTSLFDVASAVAFSPDGTRLAATDVNVLRVWRVEDGEELLTLRGTAGCVAFSPDGRRVAAADGQSAVRVWDAASGEEVFSLTGHTEPVNGVAFSADGQRIATASSDRLIHVYSADDGLLLLALPGHADAVWGVAFTPDSRRIVSASWDATARLWDAVKGRESITLPGRGDRIAAVAYSGDGRLLAAACSDGSAQLWQAHPPRQLRAFDTKQVALYALAFNADGSRMVTAGEDQAVLVWDTASARQTLAFRGHDGPVTGVVFSPEGDWVASVTAVDFAPLDMGPAEVGTAGWSEQVKLWDPVTGRERWSAEGTSCVAYSPSGTLVAAGSGGKINLFDASTGVVVRTFEGHRGSVFSLAFSPDGRCLASCGDDHFVRLWDVADGRRLADMRGHTQTVWAVTFHPDGTRLASTSEDQTVRLWDVPGGREVLTIASPLNGMETLAFSPDGSQLTTAGVAGSSQTDHITEVHIWDVGRYLVQPDELRP